jgi:hypothetical protein
LGIPGGWLAGVEYYRAIYRRSWAEGWEQIGLEKQVGGSPPGLEHKIMFIIDGAV